MNYRNKCIFHEILIYWDAPVVAYESLSCPRCENMDLKIMIIAEKGSNTQKCLKTKEEDFSEEQQEFNFSEQTRDSWTTG